MNECYGFEKLQIFSGLEENFTVISLLSFSWELRKQNDRKQCFSCFKLLVSEWNEVSWVTLFWGRLVCKLSVVRLLHLRQVEQCQMLCKKDVLYV